MDIFMCPTNINKWKGKKNTIKTQFDGILLFCNYEKYWIILPRSDHLEKHWFQLGGRYISYLQVDERQFMNNDPCTQQILKTCSKGQHLHRAKTKNNINKISNCKGRCQMLCEQYYYFSSSLLCFVHFFISMFVLVMDANTCITLTLLFNHFLLINLWMNAI